MRRIIRGVMTRVLTRRRGPTERLFGHRYTDLGNYISSKYGINRDDVTAILFDIFRYIEMEVLAGERGLFHVPRFGTFTRRDIGHGQEGDVVTSTVMRFTRSGIHRPQSDGHNGTFIDWDDEEWVDEG